MPDAHEPADHEPHAAASAPGAPAAVSASGGGSAAGVGSNGGAAPAIGGPTTSSWREDALARIAELEMLTSMACARTTLDGPIADEMAATIRRHLDTAKQSAEQRA